MYRPNVVLVALAAILLLGITHPGSAAVFGIELTGGYNTYAMSAFNDSIQSVNDSLGSTFPDITGGGGGGIALRVWPNDLVLLRFALDVLLAESESPPATFDVGPVALVATGTYYFPSQNPVRFGLGAGLGWYDIVGTLKGPGGSFDLTGGAVGLHGQGEAMWAFTPGWSLTGVLGYRYAKVSDMKLDNLSTDTEVDFSGLLFRLGLAYDWAKSK